MAFNDDGDIPRTPHFNGELSPGKADGDRVRQGGFTDNSHSAGAWYFRTRERADCKNQLVLRAQWIRSRFYLVEKDLVRLIRITFPQ